MLSRSRTPSPTVTPSPMETLGPSCGEEKNHVPREALQGPKSTPFLEQLRGKGPAIRQAVTKWRDRPSELRGYLRRPTHPDSHPSSPGLAHGLPQPMGPP